MSSKNSYTYYWCWNPRMGEKDRRGLRGNILITGTKNSVMVVLEDGEMVITSSHALRKIKVENLDNFFE